MQSDLVTGGLRRVKALWGKLADYEIPKIQRDRSELVTAVEQHFGYTRERAEQEINRRFPA